MTLQVLPQAFTVCKVASMEEIDFQSPFTFTGCTDEELSLVCPTEAVPSNALEREDGWRAFRIIGVLDFSLIGILARITALLAAEKIGVFVVSTFNTDYVLVNEKHLLNAIDTLRQNGYQFQE